MERLWEGHQEYVAQLEMHGESVMGTGAAERKCCLPVQKTLFIALCPWHGAAGLLFPGSSPEALVLQGCLWLSGAVESFVYPLGLANKCY